MLGEFFYSHTTLQTVLIPLSSYICWVLMKILMFVNKTDLIFTNVCINVTMQMSFCLNIRGVFEKQRGWKHKTLIWNRKYKLQDFSSNLWPLCLTHFPILSSYASMQSWKHYPGILCSSIVTDLLMASTHGKQAPSLASWAGEKKKNIQVFRSWVEKLFQQGDCQQTYVQIKRVTITWADFKY